ncbi:MAG: hypothetical protein WA985_02170 [Erythrobacter sp.]
MASRRNRRGKVNAKGRNENPIKRFVGLPHEILLSPAFRSLDAVARSLLTEIAMLENGRNNGSLWLSVRDATDRVGLADARPVIRGFDMLQEAGLIAMTKDAHFTVKASETSRARCWRLTWRPFDGKPPSNEWRDYQPEAGTKESKRADKGLRAMARYRKQLASSKIPVVDFTATDAN